MRDVRGSARSRDWLVEETLGDRRRFSGLIKGFVGKGGKSGRWLLFWQFILTAKSLGYSRRGPQSSKHMKFSIVRSFHCLFSVASGCHHLCAFLLLILC